MRIALVGPELEENLALRYIHSSLAAAGHEATIFDFHAASQLPALTGALVDYQPHVVGMSMVFTARAREYVALMRSLRTAGYTGHITVGGHFASFHAERLLADVPELDSVLHGEGEAAMVELAANLPQPHRVQGITARHEGKVVTTAMRPALENLDLLPWPSRSTKFHQYLGLPICDMLSSRGCFANCHFCSISAWHKRMGGPRLRQRSPQDVVGEMAYLYHNLGVRLFNFHDDNFFLPRREASIERFDAMARLMRQAGLRQVGIQIKARPDSVDRDTIAALKEMGLFRVFLGVESNAVAGLKALGRGLSREQNRAALDLLLEADLHVTFNLLMFEPDCTLADLRESTQFMREYSHVPLNFCRVEVYAGTALERRLREQGRLIGDYFGYSYAIADWRSELAFGMFRKVFTPRNFSLSGMNLVGMSAAYNLQILKQFHPAQYRRATAARAMKWLRDLNTSNADLMEEILDFAASGAAQSPREVELATARLSKERAAADAKLSRRATAMLAQIDDDAVQSQSHKTGSRVSRAAAKASVAAAFFVAVAGTHGCEKAPEPSEMAPPPTKPADGSAPNRSLGYRRGAPVVNPVFAAPDPSGNTPKIDLEPCEMVAREPDTEPASKPASQPATASASAPASRPASKPTTRGIRVGPEKYEAAHHPMDLHESPSPSPASHSPAMDADEIVDWDGNVLGFSQTEWIAVPTKPATSQSSTDISIKVEILPDSETKPTTTSAPATSSGPAPAPHPSEMAPRPTQPESRPAAASPAHARRIPTTQPASTVDDVLTPPPGALLFGGNSATTQKDEPEQEIATQPATSKAGATTQAQEHRIGLPPAGLIVGPLARKEALPIANNFRDKHGRWMTKAKESLGGPDLLLVQFVFDKNHKLAGIRFNLKEDQFPKLQEAVRRRISVWKMPKVSRAGSVTVRFYLADPASRPMISEPAEMAPAPPE